MTQEPRARGRAALAASVALLCAACDGLGEAPLDPERFRSPAGPVPAEAQRDGDAAAGYRALVNEPYVSCGMPYGAFRRALGPTPAEDRLPGRAGRNAELPYGFNAFTNADGVEVVAANCLTCHAARLNGQLVIGLGNEHLDFTADPRSLVDAVGAYVRGDAESAAWRKWAARIEAIAPYVRTDTIGVNPATNLTWALMAHRDPETLAWSDEPLLEPPPREPLPVSVPPWWRMAKKNAMFYTTVGRGDHARFMILASILCTDSLEEARAIDAYAPDLRAYIASLEPPRFPWPVDGALARSGRALFEERCSRCHGTYGEQSSYPNRVVELDVIGTDPHYALAATDGSEDRFYAWLERSFFGENARAAPARGYIAPPLDGVWATAPYLHNGSVPDMETLLDSTRRPQFWRHAGEPPEYDPRTLGWRYEALPGGKDSVDDARERARIYDTTRRGYGNGGHAFADALSPEERSALLEYLKTL